MPMPRGPTEAYGALVAWVPEIPDSVRYFVLEKGFSRPGQGPRTYWAEWRRSMRIRGADTPTTDPQELIVIALQELGAAPTPRKTPKPVGPTQPCGECRTPIGSADAYYTESGTEVCYPCFAQDQADADLNRAIAAAEEPLSHARRSPGEALGRAGILLAVAFVVLGVQGLGFAMCSGGW